MTVRSNMKIKRMTVNAIDLDKNKARVSDKIFPIEDNNEIIENFFISHFMETRSGRSTKSCRFIDDDATVKTKVYRYVDNMNDDEFIKLSNELTENLFNIMKNSTSTSSGTYFVFDLETDKEECIFLIKLDPREGVQMDYETLTLQVLEDILPDSNDRVHKCAIIRYNKQEDQDTDLFVMDKQQREGEPARFFIETYLQAEELLNDGIMTKHVIREAKSQLMELLPEVPKSKLYQAINSSFTNGTRIELIKTVEDILLDTVPEDKEDRDIFIEANSKKFVFDYLDKYPDHQTTFKVERNDNLIIYRADSDQMYFRYNKGIRTKVDIKETEEGHIAIKIDKSLNFSQDLK